MNNKFDALKDDDSGDHDQNEENSAQKDGEKEKTERDRSQSGGKRKAVVPGPAEHPLQYNYTFWYSRRTPGRPTSSQSYEQNVKQIGTFASVEQFWRFYSHMVRPGDLTGHSDFHLFKEGIKPMWEDDANKNGGKWIIRLRKGLASRCWENLILAMLGEQFMVGEEICGAVVSVRFQEDIISIWNKTASDQATTARIRDTLRRVLNLPPNTIMEYKTHTDSIKYAGPEPPAATRLLQPVIVRGLLPALTALCFSYIRLWKTSAGFSWLCYSVPPHFHITNKP
ncbi:eukaryotic translation initiation factor 4E type 2 isoform X7 [Kogia breviceps]|uniref:eukaryotic translation initiation factor 4E type 2 isoform X7 n=1 Tax=Kogia breviceps TaxID=27615 RepID=UPI002796212A|nr:eukaryotic translation initiation factor 4E type 2 isoform X4 [Kogia breviceps]